MNVYSPLSACNIYLKIQSSGETCLFFDLWISILNNLLIQLYVYVCVCVSVCVCVYTYICVYIYIYIYG